MGYLSIKPNNYYDISLLLAQRSIAMVKSTRLLGEFRNKSTTPYPEDQGNVNMDRLKGPVVRTPICSVRTVKTSYF
jgi:hypothetical protein